MWYKNTQNIWFAQKKIGKLSFFCDYFITFAKYLKNKNKNKWIYKER